ncbi:MAG: cytochrome c [Planctomycetia bacterium]|nr:cytochrome c [Planctomycetia bacterium]
MSLSFLFASASSAGESRWKFIGPTSCAALLLAGLGLAFADAPAAPKLSTIVAVADLDVALKNYLAKLKEMMVDEESYGKAKDQLGKKANAVTALLQNVGNHDGKSSFQAGAVAGMTAARDLARSKDYATAKKAYDALLTATTTAGTSSSEQPKWEKFASLGRMMHETAEVNSRVRRNLRRFEKTKEDSAEAAAILTAFAQATIYDTHEVKNPADLPKWYAMAVEMRDATVDLSKSVHGDDEAGFKKAVDRLGKSCDACHAVFHKE